MLMLIAQGFDPQRSDADFLIGFEPGTQPTIDLSLDLEDTLQQALGRPVDPVERQAVDQPQRPAPPPVSRRGRTALCRGMP